MNDVAIKVSDVSKTFKLPHEKQTTIKSALINFHKQKRGYETQQVLNDISFEIEKGEFFGIVGRNGSGKSTLLKLLAGIYTPDKGTIEVSGKLTPFIELGVGFNPELSGRENVFLNGALLGFSRKEMEAMYDEIVEFAEIERFMDQKLKNYSSGMQVRLAFSIAIRANTDILVLDEVLAVGDEAFQRKCFEYFNEIKKKKKTVVLVTHSMDDVRQFCDRAMLIDDGDIKAVGSPDKVASEYSNMFNKEHLKKIQADHSDSQDITGNLTLKDIHTTQQGRKTEEIRFRKDFSIKITLTADNDYSDLLLAMHMIDAMGRAALRVSTRLLEGFNLHKGDNHVVFDIQNIYSAGEYYVNFAVKSKKTGQLLIQKQEQSHFLITGMDTSRYDRLSPTQPNITIKVT